MSIRFQKSTSKSSPRFDVDLDTGNTVLVNLSDFMDTPDLLTMAREEGISLPNGQVLYSEGR